MADTFNLRKYYTASDDDVRDILLEHYPIQINWQDIIAEFDDVKRETVLRDENGNPVLKDGSELVRHENYEGVIFQEGTPIDASNLGRMDWNIRCNYLFIRMIWDELLKTRVQLATLLGQNQNNMPFNTFVRGADEGLVVIEGWYDEINSRGAV